MIVSISIRDHPEYISTYIDALNNPDDEELQLKAEELRQEIIENHEN